MSLYIRAVNRSRKNLNRKGALNMYVHIYELPENFLKPRDSEKVSRYGTLFIFLEKSQEKRRGLENNYWR